jgi:hypothetical protein
VGVAISLADLPAVLPYDAVVPAELGVPTAVFVTNEAAVGDVAMQVAFVYDHPKYGKLFVIEDATGASQQALEEPAEATPGCHTIKTVSGGEARECVADDFSLATVHRSSVALVVENEWVSSITWFEPLTHPSEAITKEWPDPVLEIKVMVPAGGVTRDELIEIANSV